MGQIDFSSIGGQPVPVPPTPTQAGTNNPAPAPSSLDFSSIGGQKVSTSGTAVGANGTTGSTDMQPQGNFLTGLYANTLGPIVGLGKEIYEKHGNLISDASNDYKNGNYVDAFNKLAQIVPANPNSPEMQVVSDIAKGTVSDMHNQFQKGAALAKQGRYSEAAGHLLASVLPMVGPAAANAGEHIGQGQIGQGLGEGTGLIASVLVPGLAEKGIGKIADLHESMLKTPVEPPKPVTAHVSTPVPLDDATLAKFDKSLSPEAKQTIRQHVGDSVPTGSSVQNQMVKVVKPVTDTIQQQGLVLNKILQDHGLINGTASVQVFDALKDLKDNLPGGTEDTFGKAIDKEATRQWYKGVTSSDPVEINQAIRELDRRINSYTAPEDPLNTPADAADAARVTIRRILRDKLNTEIPESKPINDVLAKNLEVRNVLRKKLGDIANEPAEAEAQHASELNKGQKYIQYEQDAARVARNRKIAAGALATVGAGALGEVGYKAAKTVLGE